MVNSHPLIHHHAPTRAQPEEQFSAPRLWRSSIRFYIPVARLAERVRIAVRMTSGLVVGKFDGLIASMNRRAEAKVEL
jgi:hypothetical protein